MMYLPKKVGPQFQFNGSMILRPRRGRGHVISSGREIVILRQVHGPDQLNASRTTALPLPGPKVLLSPGKEQVGNWE